MAEPLPQNRPPFAAALDRLSETDRLKAIQTTHAEYDAMRGAWEVLLDAFEGRGGFLDGSYLWPYPREEQSDFELRQKMARYHNYLEALIDLYVRFLFTNGVKRASKSDEYNTWLDNVDGAGTPIDDFMRQAGAVALVHGHDGILVDKTPDEPTGQTKADERAQVIASLFTALAIPDWRTDRADLTAVKLIEAPPPVSIVDEPPSGDAAKQYLIWDRDGWVRCDAEGAILGGDMPNLGLVPFVRVRPKPSYASPMLGRALVSNANIIRALFNRASEEDEVLRAQAFSVLTVAVPNDGDVQKAKDDLGTTIGTAKALVVRANSIEYQTPDQSVPGAIRENSAYLVQELYRAAHIRFAKDSLSAESGDSIRLQYTELNEMLQGTAKALAQAEREIARCWFAWTNATPEAAQAAFEAAQVEVEYPSEFFLDDLLTDLEAWAEAVRMKLGPTMTKRIKKKAARRVDPDMPPDVQEQVDKDIDAMPDEELEPVTAMPLDRGNLAAQELEAPAGG